MTTVLLIDNNADRRRTVSALLGSDGCVCNDVEQILNSSDALRLAQALPDQAGAAGWKIQDEWCQHVVSPNDYDVILLHTSNPYSKDYFLQRLKDKTVVLFSAARFLSTWAADLELSLNPAKHKFESDVAVENSIADFVHEYRPGRAPAWEVFEGLSSSAKVRERLFATRLLISRISEAEASGCFAEDLSVPLFLEFVLERIEDETLRDEARMLLASRFAGWSLAGCILADRGAVSNTKVWVEHECERLLELLCKPKRSLKTS